MYVKFSNQVKLQCRDVCLGGKIIKKIKREFKYKNIDGGYFGKREVIVIVGVVSNFLVFDLGDGYRYQREKFLGCIFLFGVFFCMFDLY